MSAAAGGVAALPIPTNTTNGGAVHRWPFIGARAPRSSRDVVRFVIVVILLLDNITYNTKYLVENISTHTAIFFSIHIFIT